MNEYLAVIERAAREAHAAIRNQTRYARLIVLDGLTPKQAAERIMREHMAEEIMRAIDREIMAAMYGGSMASRSRFAECQSIELQQRAREQMDAMAARPNCGALRLPGYYA